MARPNVQLANTHYIDFTRLVIGYGGAETTEDNFDKIPLSNVKIGSTGLYRILSQNSIIWRFITKIHD